MLNHKPPVPNFGFFYHVCKSTSFALQCNLFKSKAVRQMLVQYKIL